MLTALVIIFVLAYAAIAFEHPIKINKSASALVGAGLLWTIYAVNMGDAHLVGEHLSESLISTAQIVFFLMGAMAIVEVVDAHNGFEVITSRIKTTKLSDIFLERYFGQLDHHHRDGLIDEKAARQARRSIVLRWHHRHCCQCGRRLVTHW
jgi:hypothetical protein